jgi:hypothetical protein
LSVVRRFPRPTDHRHKRVAADNVPRMRRWQLRAYTGSNKYSLAILGYVMAAGVATSVFAPSFGSLYKKEQELEGDPPSNHNRTADCHTLLVPWPLCIHVRQPAHQILLSLLKFSNVTFCHFSLVSLLRVHHIDALSADRPTMYSQVVIGSCRRDCARMPSLSRSMVALKGRVPWSKLGSQN